MESPAAMEPPPTCSVLGVPLAITDYAGAVALTRSWVEEPEPQARAVGAAPTHLVTHARRDPAFRRALDRFDLITPDGMPCVWFMNLKGAGLRDRVYGPTLMLHGLQQPGLSHFLLGGSPEMLEKLQANLRTRFPGIRIAGAHSPPFGSWSPEVDTRIIAEIAASGANYIWVGLGCPKQELWIARNKPDLPPGVYFAVGAAFAFHAGMVKQAPRWMQNRGLEWLYRLLREPRRLWKRYAVYNTLFLYYAAKDLCFGEKPA